MSRGKLSSSAKRCWSCAPRCLLAGCGSGPRQRRRHALQRPARTDDRRAGRGIREADRHHGGSPLGRRGDARQPDPAGGLELARRRLLHREHAGAGSAATRRACWRPSAPSTLAAVPAATTPPTGAGSGSRRASRRWSTTPPRSRPRSCPSSILELAEPQWKGKLGFAPSETDFQPLITSITQVRRRCGRRTLAEGPPGQRRRVPRQRDGRRAGQQRRERRRADQPLLLVPPARRGRRRRHALGAALLRRRRPRRPGQRLGRRGSAARAPTRRTRRRFLAFLVSSEGQETIAHSDSYEYPLRPGRRAGRRPAAVRRAAPGAADARRARRRQRRRSRSSRSSGCCRRTREHLAPTEHARRQVGPARGRARRRWPLVSVAGGCSRPALVLLPLAFLVVEAQQLRLGRSAAPAAPPLGRGAAVEHGPAGARMHAAVRGARRRRGLVRGAHDAARAARCGRSLLVLPLGDPGLRGRLRLGLARPGLHGYLAAVMIMTLSLYPLVYLPVATRARATSTRSLRGGRAQPRAGPVAHVLEGHRCARSGPAVLGGCLLVTLGAARRVRSV